MPRGWLFAVPLLLSAAGPAPPPAAQPNLLPGLGRTDLLREPLGASGREAIQVRVDFPPGARAARHSHPGEELVYVLEGALEYRLDGRQPVTVRAGEVLFIPHGTVHAVTNVARGPASELATYIVEPGKPLLVPAE